MIERDYGTVANARLADRLGVSRPAVSQAVGRLKKLGLVDQDKYGAIGLSQKGRKLGENVARRHFLLEHLLVDILGYPWDKSDVEAGNMQESLSDEFTEFLSERLGNPEICPHGNPLPGAALEKHYLEAPSLTEAEEGATVRMIRITEQGELTDGMLTFCQNHGLMLGTELTIVSQGEEETVCSTGSGKVSVPGEFSSYIKWEPI